jgi:hypothetical protein
MKIVHLCPIFGGEFSPGGEFSAYTGCCGIGAVSGVAFVLVDGGAG